MNALIENSKIRKFEKSKFKKRAKQIVASLRFSRALEVSPPTYVGPMSESSPLSESPGQMVMDRTTGGDESKESPYAQEEAGGAPAVNISDDGASGDGDLHDGLALDAGNTHGFFSFETMCGLCCGRKQAGVVDLKQGG